MWQILLAVCKRPGSGVSFYNDSRRCRDGNCLYDRADVRQGYTSDKKRLRSAIDSIAPTSRTTDLTDALKTASDWPIGRTSQIEDINDIQVAEAVPATLYILSDGGFTPPPGDLGNLSAKYIPIGADMPTM